RLTGLSRTSETSVFRQNIETAGELIDGFPDTVEGLSPFRVVVLSEVAPADLAAAQQESLVRFVSELGGGVLLIGGEATFDGTWAESRLEDLLPVTFDITGAVAGLDRPFHLELEPAALRHPVFQLGGAGERRTNPQLWADLPTFEQYGKVREAKAGAVVWARHDSDSGPSGRRILMASQSYGAGRTAVLAVQNLWRWRLARDSRPEHHDRFWRQLLRWLGQTAGERVVIQPGGGGRSPGSEVEVLVERRSLPDDADAGSSSLEATVEVRDPEGAEIHRQSTELAPLRPVTVRFRAETEGLYTVRVVDSGGTPLGTRPIEIRPVNRELVRTARDLENLRQWGAVSRGLALPFEDCTDADALVEMVIERVETLRRERQLHLPLGLDPRVLALLLGALLAEWALRKRWDLA
ncbi:MAG: hypothetical protein MI919_35480, partial [Holophagales bacterium]|nr:hypothetical protein [Holophagales bacterium]